MSLSLSIRPMAQSRTMESRVGRTKQRESHYPFLRGRRECRQIIWWVGGGAPNTAVLVVCTTPNHKCPAATNSPSNVGAGFAGKLAITYASYGSSC